MKIITFHPKNKEYQNKFIKFGFDLYKDNPYWVPPLLMDLKTMFNPKKHGFYEHGEANFLLALDGDQVLGRLLMLYNRGFDDNPPQDMANFYLFEAIEDKSVAAGLFENAKNWAKDQGAKKIYGPKGMTPLDGLGLLVRGFDHRAAFGMPYNPPYYADLIQESGFNLVREIESGYINAETFQIPSKVIKAAELVEKRLGFTVMPLKTRTDLKKAVKLLGEAYNAALTGTQGNLPVSESDLKTIISGLLWIAQPELIKIILQDDEAIGFLLAYPDISSALQKTGGRLLPFGWMRLLWEKSHTDWLNINGIGIIEEFRGMAGTALLFSELYKSVTSSEQFKHAEVIQIGMDNARMRRELTDMGINFYKSHALFEYVI